MNAVAFIIISSQILFMSSANRCYKIHLRNTPRYKLIRPKTRSTKIVLSSKNVQSLEKCMEFAVAKKALAFNYGEQINNNVEVHLNHTKLNNSNETLLCEALQCPETNFNSIANETNFKYYSMYPVNITSGGGNIECIPKAGMFLFSNITLNYTDARAFCKKLNGSLAHVISEERSNGFARFISSENPNFVGLSSQDNDRIWKNEFDEPLNCFEYRAWGSGEPTHSRGCVGITKLSGAELLSFWKVLPCKLSFHFICEISPFQKYLEERKLSKDH